MLSHLYWDPDPVAFHLPFFNHPIVWYGILFALGFLVGFYLLQFLLRRFLCFYPEFTEADIVDWEEISPGKKESKEAALNRLNQQLDEDFKKEPPPSFLLHFAKRFLSEERFKRLKNRMRLEKALGPAVKPLRIRSKLFSERLTIYMIIGAVAGARLGHILFYEKWTYYLSHPLMIFKTWEGGLASHGAVIGIFIAMGLFYLRSRKEYPMISLVRIIDLLVIPSLYAGVLIRFGNFINQEILGTVTTSPWAIVFGNPAGGLPPLPRHPAQLYEAFFYFLSFLVFFRFFPKWLFPAGKIAGIFFISTFTFRFFVEFVKEEQSFHLANHFLTMGQYLSVPYILMGVAFLFMGRRIRLVSKN
ncbi:prolipoprotein diacylglyceryl transferase [Simkania sp.]|uniref:prolipoprotein diacylglyceryl transferase n=1 Tax=Simkania sp. TaxID=34094 RepID=UPI003B516782